MPADPLIFAGGVFSDQIDSGRSGAEIRLLSDRMIAAVSDGRQFSISYSECLVEIGGANGRMVFCRPGSRSLTIFCDDRRFSSDLARASGGLLDEQLTHAFRGRRARALRSWFAASVLAVAAAVLFILGFYGIRLAADASITAVPLVIDRQIGEQAFRLMDRGGPEVNDPVITDAVQHVVDRLAPHASVEGLEFDVHVIDASECNAFCLPGGTIVLYTGLIRRSTSAEQIAGVLAHEMAHASLRHGLRKVTQSLGLAAAVNLLLGNMEGLVVAAAEVFKLATINSYSRSQETAADAEGVRMLHAAGIDPMSLARFFETLQREGPQHPAGMTWLHTHPDHAARISAIREQIGTLPAKGYIPVNVNWKEVQERASKQETSK